MFDGAREDRDAFLKLCQGNELARAMRDANIAWAKNDRLRSESLHVGRFGSEADRSRWPTRRFFKQPDERRAGGRLHALVYARNVYLAIELRIA